MNVMSPSLSLSLPIYYRTVREKLRRAQVANEKHQLEGIVLRHIKTARGDVAHYRRETEISFTPCNGRKKHCHPSHVQRTSSLQCRS